MNNTFFGNKMLLNDDYLVISSIQEVLVYYDIYHTVYIIYIKIMCKRKFLYTTYALSTQLLTHTFVSCNNTFIPTFISFIHAFKPSLHSNKNLYIPLFKNSNSISILQSVLSSASFMMDTSIIPLKCICSDKSSSFNT